MNEFLPSTSKQTSIIERFGGIDFVITDIDLNHNILKPRKESRKYYKLKGTVRSHRIFSHKFIQDSYSRS
ncbi:hypothetical protein BpHYR1_036898 [Brachionus plicatilis]|uniref:Uncharacterized protein n=1 Tax=Brachionus plicatilis TaxID=10195 RepID=A0A3M7S0M8_BRAPC|nr:hypothetical protein BpHYR1_036898 [Brachionus plicatilis]